MATDKSDEPEEGNKKKNKQEQHAAEHESPKDELVENTDENTPEDAVADANDDTQTNSDDTGATPAPSQKPQHRVLAWVKSHKKVSIPVAIVLVLAVLFAVPLTRYLLAGTVLKQNFSVTVLDEQTRKPVTGATVKLSGKTATTNNRGVATIKTNVGSASLTVSKKYYTSAKKDVLVPIGKQKNTEGVNLKAIGRQVPVIITNSISGKPVANVSVKVLGAVSKTDPKGEATVVLPADKTTVEATLTGTAINNKKVNVKVTAAVDPANAFTVTPAGKIFFLSNLTGSLDVVKSNLDGTERQTVLPGTGKEEKTRTILLASRDWKYVALLSKRDGGEFAKIFLIDTASGQTTVMDEGDQVDFTVHGWSGHRFIYSLERGKVSPWQPKKRALKSFDADSKKIAVLDETNAEGPDFNYIYEYYGNVFILDQDIITVRYWSGYGYNPPYGDKQITVFSIQADGSQKKTLKTYDARPGGAYAVLDSRQSELKEIYFRYSNGSAGKPVFDAYKDGKIAAYEDTDDRYYNETYPRFIVSPSSKHTFWSEYRDGKNAFFVGDADGEHGKQLEGSSEDYSTYGWFTDEYLLVTKKNSEMHIMPTSGLKGGIESSPKINDYFKPDYNTSYGYGYGG